MYFQKYIQTVPAQTAFPDQVAPSIFEENLSVVSDLKGKLQNSWLKIRKNPSRERERVEYEGIKF